MAKLSLQCGTEKGGGRNSDGSSSHKLEQREIDDGQQRKNRGRSEEDQDRLAVDDSRHARSGKRETEERRSGTPPICRLRQP